jgi:uncharacterized protein (DUF58 family)
MDGQLRARSALTTLALGVALVLTAGLLDAEPLYVPGVTFCALVVLAGLWVVAGGTGLEVVRTVGARRVVEDEPVVVDLEVRSARPLPTGAVHDELLGRPAPLAAGRRRTRIRIRARYARRGRKLLAPPAVAVRDPFGLVTRTQASRVAPAELLVLPRLSAVTAPTGGEEGGAASRRGRPAFAAEVELDGVRAHRPGSPASRIYWPALARGRELLERRLTADSDTRPLVVLDPRGAESPADEDAAVRAAASLAHHLARQGGCALLLPGDRRPVLLDPTLRGWPHAHARLALVTGDQAPALGGVGTRRGEVIYVAARRLARPPRALAHAPAGGRVLVTPGEPPGRAVFAVAGCTGAEVSAPRRTARAA